jgi:anti-sigma28 factor (negative regulator of flagellin synthesis)
MRIEDPTVSNVYGSGAAGAAAGVELQARSDQASTPDASASDEVNLSGAAGLVAFARQASSPERQARVNAVIAQVRAGQYQADPPQVGRAVVQGHLTG